MIALLVVLLLSPQDGELDRILTRFQERRERARSEGEFKRLLADARLELEQFIKENPKHKAVPRATFQIAETYISGGELDRAFERLQAYLRDYPSGGDAPSARFAQAEILLEREKDAEARAAFEEFIKLYPADDRAIFGRFYVAITLQNEK